eukprot:817729-Pyramimonas_sp.AAC.1
MDACRLNVPSGSPSARQLPRCCRLLFAWLLLYSRAGRLENAVFKRSLRVFAGTDPYRESLPIVLKFGSIQQMCSTPWSNTAAAASVPHGPAPMMRQSNVSGEPSSGCALESQGVQLRGHTRDFPSAGEHRRTQENTCEPSGVHYELVTNGSYFPAVIQYSDRLALITWSSCSSQLELSLSDALGCEDSRFENTQRTLTEALCGSKLLQPSFIATIWSN